MRSATTLWTTELRTKMVELIKKYRQSINPPYTRKDFIVFFATILILAVVEFGGALVFRSEELPSPVRASGSSIPRGISRDLWADIVLGQPDFAQAVPKEIVSFKVAGPGGSLVDRSSNPNRVYIYDGMNSRVLGYSSLGVCQNDAQKSCTCDSDCPGSTCTLGIAGEDSTKTADLVIGQPDFNSAACNGDGTFLSYPDTAPASAASLCSLPQGPISVFESGSFASMAVDSQGDLFVPDYFNHRVLKYNSPFTTDTVADEVWGQGDFSANDCNKGGSSPGAATLCFDRWSPNRPFTAGVDIDSQGNLWVADAGNNRVLRFPLVGGQIAKTADLVLGQSDFTSNSSGSALNKLYIPTAVRVDSVGKVFVTDTENHRVMVFAPPITSGMSGTTFGSNFRKPTGIELDPDLGNPGGVWVSDTNNNQLVLFNQSGAVQKVLFKNSYRPDGTCGNSAACNSPLGYDSCRMCDARGSVGITSDGDIIASSSDSVQNTHFYKHPIPAPSSNPHPAIATFFGPPYYSHNYLSNRGFMSARGIVVTASQLIVLDAQRIMYWNTPSGVSDLTDGKPADGVAGVPDFKTFASPHFIRISADDNGNLWALRGSTIEHYSLPLSLGEMPDQTILSQNLQILGQGSLGMQVSFTGIFADSQGRYLWLSAPDNDRVVRVRIPQGAGNYIIDTIIGGTSIPVVTQGWQLPCDQHPNYPNSFCYPGAVTEDRNGNLFISDYYIEQAGSGRFFRFDPSLFPVNNPSLIILYTTSAAGQFTNVKGWQPAFDSQNRMVLGFSAYDASRFPLFYNDILAQSGPNLVSDGQLNDYSSQSFTAAFDSHDNLYITDLNWGRVLIYKNPFGNPQTKIGDLDKDGDVDVADLEILVNSWGATSGVADINKDNVVDIFDLSTLLSNWGT